MTPTEDKPEIAQLPVADDDEPPVADDDGFEIARDDADTDFQEQARAVASNTNMKKKKCAIALIASAAFLGIVVGLGAGLGTKNGNKSVSAANNAATYAECLKEEKELEEQSMEGISGISSTTDVPTWMPTAYLPTTYLPTEATGEEESAAATMGAAPVRYSNDYTMMNVQDSNDGLVRRELRSSSTVSSSAASKVHELKGSSKSRRLQCDEFLADQKSTSSGGESKSGKFTKSPNDSKKSPKASKSSKKICEYIPESCDAVAVANVRCYRPSSLKNEDNRDLVNCLGEEKVFITPKVDISTKCDGEVYNMGLYAIGGSHFFLIGSKEDADSGTECPPSIFMGSIKGEKKIAAVFVEDIKGFPMIALGLATLDDILLAEESAEAFDESTYDLFNNSCPHYAGSIWRAIGLEETDELANFLIQNIVDDPSFVELAKKTGGARALAAVGIGGKGALKKYVAGRVYSQLEII